MLMCHFFILKPLTEIYFADHLGRYHDDIG